MEKLIKIDNLKVHFSIIGNPKNKTLVFLHAMRIKSKDVRNFTNELSKYFYVIAPEIAGHMRSETPKDWNHKEYVEFFNKFINERKIKKFILVGNSFGGGIATAYAKKYPKKIQKLILIDAVFVLPYKTTEFVSNLVKNNLLILESKYVPVLLKKFIVWNQFGTPFSLITKEDIERKIKFLRSDLMFDVDYGKLKMPVVMLWGRSDTKIHPIKYAREIARMHPKIKLVEYDGNVPTIYRKPKKMVKLLQDLT